MPPVPTAAPPALTPQSVLVASDLFDVDTVKSPKTPECLRLLGTFPTKSRPPGKLALCW
jgi:hypothetical protein